MRFPRMKKILSLLAALVLASALYCAAGTAETACYRIVWTDGPAYGYSPVDVPVMVITNDPAQDPVTEASALEEIDTEDLLASEEGSFTVENGRIVFDGSSSGLMGGVWSGTTLIFSIEDVGDVILNRR